MKRLDILQMENILNNLNNLESSFKQLSHNANYDQTVTYYKYLQNLYIQKNDLGAVYWPQSDEGALIVMKPYLEIREEWLFLKGNITLMKQINLPYSTMLINDFFQCIYVMEGMANLKLDYSEKKLKKGDFFILYPGVNHVLNTADDSIVINILVKKEYMYSDKVHILNKYPISKEYQAGGLCSAEEKESLLFHTVENVNIKNTILQMFIEYLQNQDFKDEVMHAHLSLLLVYLIRYQIDDIESAVQLDTSQKVFDKIYRYCSLNLSKATLKSTAESLHYSKQYICRIVKMVTNDTFSAMLNHMKIESVKKYLKESNLTLSYIAEIVGFTDAAHLSRIFKQHTGITPSVYRSQKEQ